MGSRDLLTYRGVLDYMDFFDSSSKFARRGIPVQVSGGWGKIFEISIFPRGYLLF
jgi:hypothetical protein